jgi:hypothetical protein
VELRRFVLDWLRVHPGTGGIGPCGTHSSRDLDAEHADFCRQVLNTVVASSGSLAQPYLEGRGLHANWPVDLVGYIADDERPGEGAIIGVITDAHGVPAGIQLGYLDSYGRKHEVNGTDRRTYFIDRQTPGLRFHVVPTALDPAAPLFVTEGLENALSLAVAYPAAEIIGLPGIGRMRRLPPFVGRDVVVFRDGDAPEAPASRALMVGVDHLLIGGSASVKITDTPLEADANSVLQDGGIAAIHMIVDGATSAELSPKGIVRKLAALHEFDYQLVRRQHAKTLGIKYSALDHQVALERARHRGNSRYKSVVLRTYQGETGNRRATPRLSIGPIISNSIGCRLEPRRTPSNWPGQDLLDA